MTKIIERVAEHYDTQETEFGRTYTWCPEYVVLECTKCAKKMTITIPGATGTPLRILAYPFNTHTQGAFPKSGMPETHFPGRPLLGISVNRMRVEFLYGRISQHATDTPLQARRHNRDGYPDITPGKDEHRECRGAVQDRGRRTNKSDGACVSRVSPSIQ